MKKNFSMIIAGGIGIAIIILIIALYNNQESEITIIDEQSKNIEVDEQSKIEFHFNNSEILENPEIIIQEKLDEIKENAAENIFNPAPREWQTSGPFQIDRSKYLIGEKIFIRIGELDLDEKGQIALLRPLNETHVKVWQTIPFDGTKKPAFNFYTQPSLLEANKICTVDDIIGEWTVVFRGTSYPNLKFEIINEILPGDEESYVPVC